MNNAPSAADILGSGGFGAPPSSSLVGEGFSSQLIPSGSVIDYAGTTTPVGWLACDGSLVSRNLYAALFAAIGTTYGAGDGATTFALPDTQGRVTVGLAGVGGHADVTTIGNKDATALGSRRPTHKHSRVVTQATIAVTTQPTISVPTRPTITVTTQPSISVTTQPSIAVTTQPTATASPHNHTIGGGTKNFGVDSSGPASLNAAGAGNWVPNTDNATVSITMSGGVYTNSGGAYANSGGAYTVNNDGSYVNAGGVYTNSGGDVTVGPQTGAEPTDLVPYIVFPKIIKT